MAGYRLVKTGFASESGETGYFRGREGVKVPSGKKKLTAGEVSKLTGLKRSTLRHYDDIGLLCPQRTGEGISNNRKLYSDSDLGRLQTIQTLSAYHFSLDEIKQFFNNDEQDIYELLTEKILQLIYQEERLRILIRFVQFIEVVGTDDIIESLALGPTELDELADFARECDYHEKTLQKLDKLSDTEAKSILEELNDLMTTLFLADSEYGFSGVEVVIDFFFDWWNKNILPFEDIGYLGFLAIFEDHSLVAEYIETVGEPGDASTIQMYTFFVIMKKLMFDLDSNISEIAKLAQEDILEALDKIASIEAPCLVYLLGTPWEVGIDFEDIAGLSYIMLSFIENILENEELSSYLGVSSSLSYNLEDINTVMRVLELIGGIDEGDEKSETENAIEAEGE